jgi:hypothetical protein
VYIYLSEKIAESFQVFWCLLRGFSGGCGERNSFEVLGRRFLCLVVVVILRCVEVKKNKELRRRSRRRAFGGAVVSRQWRF